MTHLTEFSAVAGSSSLRADATDENCVNDSCITQLCIGPQTPGALTKCATLDTSAGGTTAGDAEKIAAIATLSAGEVLGWFRWVTGFYHNSRNWLPGEKAALINRAEQLKLKIEGLNA